MRTAGLISIVCLMMLPTSLAAKDVYLAIGGSVGNFRTDARILNPSSEKEIQVQAWLLRVGNVDNSGVQAKPITVPRRGMVVLDDVVSTHFNADGLGAIRLSSDDDFIATQRIYAQTTEGTLGQFVPGIEASTAVVRGALIQLKAGAAFRTNVGAVNPNPRPATVRWRLYDRQNEFVAEGAPIVMQPFGVIAPTSIKSGFFFNSGAADLSDAWVSFTSDEPIVAYASVIDNATTDPTYITAAEDTGEDAARPVEKTFNVTASQFTFSISPSFSISVGDQVTLRITSADVTHGFMLIGPDGATIIPPMTVQAGQGALVRTFSAQLSGTYNYFCTVPSCGTGHSSMTGAFTVSE